MTQKRPYESLNDWMERTGTNNTRLLAMVKDKTGHTISPALLSMILKRSRRCSRFNAFALHMVTGLDMDILTQWKDERTARFVENRRRAAKETRKNIRENENVA